ncbi:glycosyltransferase [Ornithinicoccus halotolerans]|uniref:glycosyltransferase n=1 Tax=Ornithinicoccus halotolerans TaxID=1748220 RepID=UPI001E57760A|nr:glycosyltransferase [Ornithinicoccus halotolerans]
MSPVPARVAAVVPAKDEQRRIAATLRALAAVPGVDLVVVVDDGSNDRTADVAAQAGAIVVRHQRNRGKGAAMTTGAEEVARIDARQGGEPHLLLFADADLQASAAGLSPLPGPVAVGEADMTIAVLPPQQRPGGGFGLVVRTARTGIRRLTGWRATQPLSGMRCLTQEAFQAATPLARGWGVEVGLTVDLLRAGMRVTEVPCSLQHRVTGRDWRGQLHRARQLRDVTRALAARVRRRR